MLNRNNNNYIIFKPISLCVCVCVDGMVEEQAHVCAFVGICHSEKCSTYSVPSSRQKGQFLTTSPNIAALRIQGKNLSKTSLCLPYPCAIDCNQPLHFFISHYLHPLTFPFLFLCGLSKNQASPFISLFPKCLFLLLLPYVLTFYIISCSHLHLSLPLGQFPFLFPYWKNSLGILNIKS